MVLHSKIYYQTRSFNNPFYLFSINKPCSTLHNTSKTLLSNTILYSPLMKLKILPPLSFHTSYRDLAGVPRDQLRRRRCHNTRYQSNADATLGQSWRHSSTIQPLPMTRVDLLASIKTTQTQFKTLDCGSRRHSAWLMFGQCCRRWACISGPFLLSPAGRLTMTALSPLLNHSRQGR